MALRKPTIEVCVEETECAKEMEKKIRDERETPGAYGIGD